MRIYLIRHGETVHNAARILQLPETPLSARGIDQARRLADRLRGQRIQAILSSDYRRALDTAAALSTTTGAPVETSSALRERNLGDHRGRALADLTVDVFAADHVPPNGESWAEFHARVERAWREVRDFAAHATHDFAVVSHALVCHSLVERCVHTPAALRPPELRFGNTAVTCIDGPPWTVSLLGCTRHLDPDQVTFPNHPPPVTDAQ